MWSLPKLFTSKSVKEYDITQEQQYQQHSGRSPPVDESDPRSSSGFLTRGIEGLDAKVQDVHPPKLLIRQPSKELSASLLPTAPPAVSSAHNTHPPDRMSTNTTGGSSMWKTHELDTTLNNESVEVPIQEDAIYDPPPMSQNQHAHDPQYTSGFFTNARNFTLHNPIMVNATNNIFLREFAGHTIKGAELDSSARDPPPRCHPGTRVEIVERMRSRLSNPTKRAQWLVGPAGVGKSAIMQTLAELEQNDSAVLAALFFSAPNGRNDPSKVITTLAYQIALQHEKYYHHVRLKVNADPKLWEKSIDVHFTEFIVKPFATMQIHTGTKPVLMFIDGLDECKGQYEQIRILSLIFDFTTKYPQAPLLWVIASRPEAHITEYLNSLTFYDKEEVSIDSTTACQDVERYLRAEFEKIQASNSLIKSLYRQWPPENQLMRLVSAILGLFAYAETAIRFIRDLTAGDPISRLQVVLDLIEKSLQSLSVSDTEMARPMAHLDSLYRYILSQISPDNIPRIEEILAYVIFSGGRNLVTGEPHLVFMCNWIGMLPNVVYGALFQLHSVVRVPIPDNAHRQRLQIYHKSFSDFILDPHRSGLSIGTVEDERHRYFLRSTRVLENIPYPVMGDPRDNIILSWPCYTVESQNNLYFTASHVFTTMTSLPDISLPQIAHALKVLWWNFDGKPVNEWGYQLLFHDTHPELTRLLREDGALQDIPVGLLDLNVIRERSPFIGKESICDSTVQYEGDYSIQLSDELVTLLVEAQARSPHDLVRVFIGTGLTGIVRFKTSVRTERLIKWFTKRSFRPEVYVFMYDFSTIYERLKERRVGGLTK